MKQRAIAQGIFNAGASLGSVISPILIGFLYGHYGWKVTYIIIGLAGVLWVIPWLFLNKSKPETHPWITAQEKQLILSSSDAVSKTDVKEKGLSVFQILKHKESWGVLLASIFIEPIWWLFVGWLPIYLNFKYGFSVKEIGSTIWISYLGGMAGSIIGGWVCGKLIDLKSVDFARKSTIAIGCLLMFLGLIGILFFVEGESPMTFIYIVGIVLFGFQFAIGNLQTIASDLFKGPSVGTLAGLAGMIGAVSVSVMNWLIPKITTVSYTPAFVIIAILAPLTILSIMVLIKKIEIVDKY